PGAQPVEEAGWEVARDQRAGAGVVGMPDAAPAALAGDSGEMCGDIGQGLVPAGGREAALALGPDAAQRLQQTLRRITPGAVIGERAFAAERAAADRMVGVAQDLGNGVAALDHGDAAAVIAVARAGGADDDLGTHEAPSAKLSQACHRTAIMDRATSEP